MSGKEGMAASGQQAAPVDLATKPAASPGPTVAQIRIPTVTTGLRAGAPGLRIYMRNVGGGWESQTRRRTHNNYNLALVTHRPATQTPGESQEDSLTSSLL